MSERASVSARLGVLFLPFLFACTEQTVEVELHSLQASGDVAFVCRGGDRKGYDRSLCPDFDDRGFKIFALVTQTSTEEIAVIDTVEAKVIDLDPSIPGYSFLRVPSRPGHVVTSPGGAATFVGIVGPGKEGITAIPTTCIDPPTLEETPRDVTSFPSCHLPSAPGDLAVLIQPPGADGSIPESCDVGSAADPPKLSREDEPEGECRASLLYEHLDPDDIVVGPVGRRKLAVALPDMGEVVVIDGQWLLDQTPGSFPDCRIEARLPLGVDLGPSDPEQYVPPELDVDPEVCTIEQPRQPAQPPSFAPSPAGFALADNLLYVADAEAPVVHVLDVSNPCALNELPSLLPTSFDEPDRDVVTLKVAASPLTPDGKRYLYAIDRFDDPTSLMAFDVSPGSTQRTPLVRPGSLRIPEPPDRLQLGAPIEDVAFALRDLETTDPETGVAESGVRCDPNPDTAPQGSPAAQHRPTSDETRGAQPRLLRGLFGLALLNTGHVAFIDVDDFDGPCRRPYTTNPDDQEDFRGCFGDVVPPNFLTADGLATGSLTVTNEASCTVVSPHRFRSALFNRTNPTDGVGAPALASFPEFLHDEDTAEQPPPNQPKLLAVPFDAVSGGVPPEAQVYIGTTLHTTTSTSAPLPTDPNTALVPSLTLPLFEPRAFAASEATALVYEGPITTQFRSGSVVFDPTDLDDQFVKIQDPTAQFCSRGVYSKEMFAKLGNDLGVAASESEAFENRHADVVEVTSDFLPSVDDYWVSPRLLDPESAGGCGLTYSACVDTFDNYDSTSVSPNREFEVIDAFQDRLVIEPRGVGDDVLDDEQKRELSRRLECCFPQGLEYRVRAQNHWVVIGSSGATRNDVTARRKVLQGDPNDPEDDEVVFRCDRDCDPRKTYWNSRVFEVAADPSVFPIGTDCTAFGCAVGLAQEGDACRYDPCDPAPGGSCRRDGALRLPGTKDAAGNDLVDEDAVGCVFSGLNARFVVYRGLSPSVRGMEFRWQTVGGFRTLVTSIEAVSIAVLPQHVEYVPELQRIAIIDGAQLGLSLVSLDSLRVEDPWPVY